MVVKNSNKYTVFYCRTLRDIIIIETCSDGKVNYYLCPEHIDSFDQCLLLNEMLPSDSVTGYGTIGPNAYSNDTEAENNVMELIQNAKQTFGSSEVREAVRNNINHITDQYVDTYVKNAVEIYKKYSWLKVYAIAATLGNIALLLVAMWFGGQFNQLLPDDYRYSPPRQCYTPDANINKKDIFGGRGFTRFTFNGTGYDIATSYRATENSFIVTSVIDMPPTTPENKSIIATAIREYMEQIVKNKLCYSYSSKITTEYDDTASTVKLTIHF